MAEVKIFQCKDHPGVRELWRDEGVVASITRNNAGAEYPWVAATGLNREIGKPDDTFSTIIEAASEETGVTLVPDRTKVFAPNGGGLVALSEAELIAAIGTRAVDLYKERGLMQGREIQAWEITALIAGLHRSTVPLKLGELLNADDYEFLHDVSGLWNEADHATYRIRSGFLPRHAIDDTMYCDECGCKMEIGGDGVSHHLTEEGDINYEQDARHVAYCMDADDEKESA